MSEQGEVIYGEAGVLGLPELRQGDPVDDGVLPHVLCDQAAVEFRAIVARLNAALVGRDVRITGLYNGQPVGSSRPMLTGKVLVIDRVMLDSQGPYFFLRGQRLAIRPKDVEFEVPA